MKREQFARSQFPFIKAVLADLLTITNGDLPEASMISRDVHLHAHDAFLLIDLLRITRQSFKVWERLIRVALEGIPTHSRNSPIRSQTAACAVAASNANTPHNLYTQRKTDVLRSE